MGVVDDAVEDGVGEGGIADDVMPFLDRELAGDDAGGDAVPVVGNLQEVAPRLCVERGEAPIVEDQQADPGKAGEQLGIAAVGAGQGEVLDQARQVEVADGNVVPARGCGLGRHRPAKAITARWPSGTTWQQRGTSNV